MIIMKFKSFMYLTATLILVSILLTGCGTPEAVDNDTNETSTQQGSNSSENIQQTTTLESKIESSEQESKRNTVWHPGDPSQVSSAYKPDSTISAGSNVTHIDNNISLQSDPEYELESEVELEKEGKEVHIGDTIKTDFAEMTLDSYHIAKQINPVNPKKQYYFFWDCKEGSTYFYFTGTYKNISSRFDTVSFLDTYITINGKYKYLASDIFQGDDSFEPTGGLDPLESTRYFVYADIPDELMSSFSTADIEFEICGYVGDDTKFEKYTMSIKK